MNPLLEKLPNGQLIIKGDTHLSAWAKTHGSIITDPSLFRWLKPRLEGVKVVWDVGAAIGDHSRQYRDWGMEVHAFEPNPLAYECLTHNCPDCECYNIAASDEVGELQFTQLDNAGASRITPNGEITVSAYPLDSMDLPAPDFVKADCEGFEMRVLRGMRETLTEYKPIVYCEINAGALAANGESYESVRGFLESLGYTDFLTYPPNASYSDLQFDLLVKP